MDSQLEQRLQALRRTFLPGRSFESDIYTDPKVFEVDLTRVFFRNWLFAGHAAQISRPGDYFLCRIANESVIIIRGDDGAVHGLLNVCAHRGSRICLEPTGSARRLVCPYHGWCYKPDGSLHQARNMPEDFDRASAGLRRLTVRVDEGLIHFSFADEPPDFGPIADDLRKFFGPHGWSQAKVAVRETVTIRANWKLVAENFMECYHCPPAHPELAAVMSYVRAYDSPALAEERRKYTLRWEARARALGHVAGSNRRNEGLGHSVSRVPIREGFLTQSQDGQPVAPLMGSLKEYDGGVTSIQFFPNNWYVANNDYGMLSRFTPISPEETEAEITWIVRGDAKEGADYELGRLTWLWKATMDQDREITENNQAGVGSRFFRPGPHSRDENLEPFHRWYLDRVGAESTSP